MLDTLACAVAGHQGEETEQVSALAGALAQSNETSVIGGDRLSLAGATLLNGYLVTAVTMCDIHRSTLTHVTPEVIPPALAIAEPSKPEPAKPAKVSSGLTFGSLFGSKSSDSKPAETKSEGTLDRVAELLVRSGTAPPAGPGSRSMVPLDPDDASSKSKPAAFANSCAPVSKSA